MLIHFLGSIKLIVGGYDMIWQKDRNYSQTFNLSNSTTSCKNLPGYPIPMSSATGAIVSGKPLICGGWSVFGIHSECYQHNNVSNSWENVTYMNTHRYYSASVSLNGKLFMMGGSDGSVMLRSTEYVSPEGLSQLGPNLPQPRYRHCGVKLSNGKVMVLGGIPEGTSVITFDPEAETFDQSLSSMAHNRMDFGCAVLNSPLHDNREVVLAAGGFGQATAEILDYTQPNATWTESNYTFIFLSNLFQKLNCLLHFCWLVCSSF